MTKKALFLFSIVIFFLVVSVSYILQKQDFIFTPANKFSATSEPVPSELESGKKPPEEKLILMPDEVAELAKNQTSEQTPLAESTNQNVIKWEDSFYSTESAEAYFVNEEGELLKSGLDSFFKAKDLDEILDAMDKVGTNEKSVSRKNKLKDYFYKEFAATAYSERFSCANKICAVTFIGDPEATERYQNLAQFSENYIFTKSTVNEYGEGVYKMLVIETEDASSLTVKPN
tara:strand:+ start:9429 stop:10121 length:693 start_codon:yes stop_codon:yes gene_type:complete